MPNKWSKGSQHSQTAKGKSGKNENGTVESYSHNSQSRKTKIDKFSVPSTMTTRTTRTQTHTHTATCHISTWSFFAGDDGGGAATVTSCVVTRVRSNLSILLLLKDLNGSTAATIIIVADAFPLFPNPNTRSLTVLWPELDIISKWNCRKKEKKYIVYMIHRMSFVQVDDFAQILIYYIHKKKEKHEKATTFHCSDRRSGVYVWRRRRHEQSGV